MASDLENVQAALAGARLKLANALRGDYSSAEEFKPGAAGQLDRATYIRELRETIKFLKEELSAVNVFEETSEMYPQ